MNNRNILLIVIILFPPIISAQVVPPPMPPPPPPGLPIDGYTLVLFLIAIVYGSIKIIKDSSS